LEYAVLNKVVDLPQAIALSTRNVAKAIPEAAPNRGELAEGKIADIAIVNKNCLYDVRTVIIRGKIVVDDGKVVESSE
jgi:imidazolonepropionase-like amidohydrolase